jgi:hypothetical protein
VVKQLSAAVARGSGLIVDAQGDDRSKALDTLTGVKYLSDPKQPIKVVLGGVTAPLPVTGSFTYRGDTTRLQLITGIKQAGFGSLNGDPAIITNTGGIAGLGKTVHFAFDLVSTLQATNPSTAEGKLLSAYTDAAHDLIVPPLTTPLN